MPASARSRFALRRSVVAVVLSLLVAALASTSARAGDQFVFHGSGYGHGLGMSQWGAYGLARMGWSHERILTHFYQHTRVQGGLDLPNAVRVGLTQDRDLVHLRAQGGPVRLWIGKPHGRLVGRIPGGREWSVRAADDGFAIRDHDGELVGGHRWGGTATDLFATYADVGSRVFVPEADAIWGDGFSYARGHLELNLYGCASGGCEERLVLPLGLEEYLYGLAEVPTSWPAQALQAQATAGRTFAVHAIRRPGLRSDCNCDLTDGSGDQVYAGYDREGGAGGDLWVKAVRASRNEVVTYDGSVIQAFFAASDGGHSENVEDVWWGGDDRYAIPWLHGVCDPGESTDANPWTDWTRSYTSTEVTSRLGLGIGEVQRFARVRRGRSGRIVKVTVKGSSGSERIEGYDLRVALGLPDDRVWIGKDRNITGPVRERYDAAMCRPGLPESPTLRSPKGSRQRFHLGAIYHTEAAGLSVWLHGPVFGEYASVKGVSGPLGWPTSTLLATSAIGDGPSCPTCRRIAFERGRIYSRDATGTHALWGRVLGRYLQAGGVGGRLGWPLTRVRTGGGEASARFQHGTLTCPDADACRVRLS